VSAGIPRSLTADTLLSFFDKQPLAGRVAQWADRSGARPGSCARGLGGELEGDEARDVADWTICTHVARG
jgi:hypothetical protein